MRQVLPLGATKGGRVVTARKPPPLPLEYGAQAYIGVPGDGEIRIFANNDGSGDMSLSPRAARALAHWLTLAAEYAESLESQADPVEELADAQLGLTGALK